MKNRLPVLLLLLCLFLPLAAFSEGSEVSCQAGDTIEVIFSPVSDADMPDMLVGHLEYDHDVFEPVPGQFNLTSQDGLYIYGGSPAKVSFRVSRFTPDGTYEISLKVLDAAGSGAEQATVPPVRVTVGSGRAASSETVAVLSVSGHCGDNAFWDYQDGTLTIYGSGATYDYADAAQVPWNIYRDTMTHIVINNGITSIGQYHFYACTALTSVSLPNSLKVIGPAAFEECTSLAKITLPGHLEDIQEYAFYNCSSLTNAEIPGNVWQIGDSAFRNCSSLQEINLPESVTTIGPAAFCGCVRAAVLNLSPQITMIPYDCFDGCTSLTAVTIPSSVTAIGYRAFKDCHALDCVIIPESVKNIDVSTMDREERNPAFEGCDNLAIWCFSGSAAQAYARKHNIPVVIPDGKCGDNLYWKLDGTELTISGSGGMDDYGNIPDPWRTTAPWGGKITSLTIKEGITSIGNYAFYCSHNLSDIVLPSSLITIGFSSFHTCENLSDFDVPKNLESIGGTAFAYCAKLNAFTIPASVTSIEDGAFCNCFNLQQINISTDNISFYMQNGALIGNSGKLIAYLIGKPESIFVVPENVTSIGGWAFANAINLKTIIVPNSVTEFGFSVFDNNYIEKIECYKDSAAHTYALENNIPFVLLPTFN